MLEVEAVMSILEIILLVYVAAVWFLAWEAREAPGEPRFNEPTFGALMVVQSPPLWTTQTEAVLRLCSPEGTDPRRR